MGERGRDGVRPADQIIRAPAMLDHHGLLAIARC